MMTRQLSTLVGAGFPLVSALDALVMGAAMPSIVAHLGGLHLYSWAFSSYLLSRAVALPLFGKLCDLYSNKKLFNVSICIFLAGSVSAGISQNMTQLILSRVIQGIGAGGSFALTYIVLSDISSPEKRGKMMSFASFVWGVASVLGPTIGGFIVNYFSWRWIFFINIPVGVVSLLGIFLYLIETREKREAVSIDYLGMLTLSSTILALLIAFLLAGRSYPWLSFQIVGLFAVAAGAGRGHERPLHRRHGAAVLHHHVEPRHPDPPRRFALSSHDLALAAARLEDGEEKPLDVVAQEVSLELARRGMAIEAPDVPQLEPEAPAAASDTDMLPAMQRSAEAITIPWVFHSDGNIMSVVEELIDLGISGLHPIEPGPMDLAVVKERYGDRLCIIGNVSVDALSASTPADIDEIVRQCILTAGKGGGYMISSANSIPAYAKPENVVAMAEAIRKYGRYPITV